ncbi:SLC13 family permease [Dysgonomonas sp. 520]|uniref:SLC13 family permease n=1 Tax=Dysgonomonas sp. 520 TaxID=2302931 RepID=UPI0013CF711F|nr:SLC13 family permease [Dysgonomonas sp. 520]NDW10345.1 sodium-coupled transporter [Dysgonomonas sp. 520]
MKITLLILLLASIFFMRGKVRSDLVALCALLALMLTNILTPSEALSGFSNSVVIMMVGLFVVGGGIFRTGLAKMISSKILSLAGSSETRLFVLVMIVTASIGAFVSNTGTVAVMIPIVVSMAAQANISSRRLLMPLAFASSMGILTLISTPPNMVIQEKLIEYDFEPLAFFDFTPVGLIALSVGIVLLYFLSKWFLSSDESSSAKDKQGKSLDDLIKEYNISQTLYVLHIEEKSPIAGFTLKELKIASIYNINISKISRLVKPSRLSRPTISEEMAGPNTMVNVGDRLYCTGKKEDIERFAQEAGLTIKDTAAKEEGSFSDFQNIGVAEVFIMPSSRLINRRISDTNFREEYNVNIIGIQHNNKYMTDDFQNMKLQSGDALLIQGTWDKIASIGKTRQNDLVLVGQPLEEAKKVTLDNKAPIAATIMIFMVLAMVLNIVPAVTAVMIAAVLMVVTGCLRNMEEAYNNINWESVVLIAAMMPMSLAFEKTGAAALISEGLVNNLGQYGEYALLAGIYFGTSILTMFISNTATAVLFAPIAMSAALGMGCEPYPFLFAVTVAASMCFASPFSTPPNALVMSAGKYTFMDYVKVGLPLQIIMGIVMIFVLPLLFPFHKAV